MTALTCELPPINLRLPGANAVMNDIPVGSSTSPSSLDVDHEQLTVQPRFATSRLSTNLFSLESESFIILMRENRSPCVRPVVAASAGAHFILHWFQFEVVNKRVSLTELDSIVVEVDPIPDNIFKRILKVGFSCAMLCRPRVNGLDTQAIFYSCISRKARRVKANSFGTISTV